MLDAEKETRRKISLYRYCLEHWHDNHQDLGSALTFRAEAVCLLQRLSSHLNEPTQRELEERLRTLDLEREQLVSADHRAYVASLRQELATDLRIIEADLGFLPRLIYEEALHLWVAVETAGHVLDELDRVDGTARHAGERARYETLWRRLEERILELPKDSEVRQTRLATLPPPAVTLPDVLSAVRRWTPAERYALGQELEREYLYETVSPEAGQRAVVEERADYSPGENKAHTEEAEKVPCV
jgi:hypothetical protein